MKHTFVFMTECTKRLVNSIPDGQKIISIDVQDLLTKFSNDLAIHTVFGLECNSFENLDNEFYKTGKSAFLLNKLQGLKFFGAAISPLFATLFKISFFSEYTKNFYRNIIRKTLEYREKNNITRIDLLHLLKEAQKGRLKYETYKGKADRECSVPEDFDEKVSENYTPREITDDELTVHIIEIQERLVREVDATWGKCNGKLTYEDLLNMKYMDMICSESNRLRSPTVFLDRKVTKPYTIEPVLPHEKPVHLKPRQDITIPVYCFLMDPDLYPNPYKFDPERFSDERKHSIQSPHFCLLVLVPGHAWVLAGHYLKQRLSCFIFYADFDLYLWIKL